MINYREASLNQVAVHFIGNEFENENIILSPKLMDISEEDVYQNLVKYFLSNFKEPEFFTFNQTAGDLELNPIYSFVSNVFEHEENLYEQSIQIANFLFEKSKHHNIKSGELFVFLVKNVLVEDEMVDALGIFKSENKDAFLRMFLNENNEFEPQCDLGTNMAKLDKACIIFNTDKDSGYKIVNIDHSNRYKEAQYWRDDFLNISHRSDDYHHTKNYIQLTKNFVKDRLPSQFDKDKSEQAQTMNRSFEYFSKQEKFDQSEYETRVFKDDQIVEAFQEYKSEFETQKKTTLFNEFDISDYAVKKQSKVFKSVIKLDKNFHIYVHTNQDLIEKGIDEYGRKYYIIYYEDEN